MTWPSTYQIQQQLELPPYPNATPIPMQHTRPTWIMTDCLSLLPCPPPLQLGHDPNATKTPTPIPHPTRQPSPRPMPTRFRVILIMLSPYPIASRNCFQCLVKLYLYTVYIMILDMALISNPTTIGTPSLSYCYSHSHATHPANLDHDPLPSLLPCPPARP